MPDFMATTTETLDRALKLHQQGNLSEAERLYKEVLANDAHSADAWHLLGLIEHARGEFDAALEHIGRAIQLDNAQASFHNHLGEVFRSLDKLPEAEACCRKAVGLDSRYAIGHNTLGAILAEQGKLEEAAISYRQAITLKPDFVQAQLNLGLALQSLGERDAAIAAFRQALALDPGLAQAHHHLGTLLHAQARWDEAIACYRRALALQSDLAAAHCNLGSVLKEQGHLAEAVECFLRALSCDPDLAEAHFNLGVIHQNQGHAEQAIDCYQSAIRAKPDYAEAISNLGTVLKSQGKLDEAMDCYERALAIRDDLAEGHRNRALLRLMLGNFAAGWEEYEWRWRVKGAARPPFAQPRWQGQPLAGRAVLLRAEQGLGDEIQFVRYAPLVKQRSAGEVLLECPRAMHALLRTAAGIDRLVTAESRGEAFDGYLPLLSLPAVFGTRLESIPAEIPYLFAEPARIEHWRRQLAAPAAFNVGIAWQGNPGYPGDATRSIPLEHFAPLARLAGVQLFGLQKGPGHEQVATLADRMPLVDLAATLDENGDAFVDTAAVMMSLDLVITSDTAIAHLAGALGVRVWVALQQVPEWRWLLDRDDSPWYPTMRLFRQTRFGDWTDVFARIAAELNCSRFRHGDL